MPVVITCVEVPDGIDVAVTAPPGGQVHRALAPDARFRYIAVGESEPAVQVRGTGAGAVTAPSGRYEICHRRDDPSAPYGPDGTAIPVIFINCMAVPPGNDEVAFAFWRTVNDYMVAKPGYRWHRLHRRLHDDAPFGLVNVVEWESAEAWQAAHDDGFRSLTVRPDLPFEATPTLCELIEDNDRRPAVEIRS